MIELLLFNIGWMIIGYASFVLGTIIDKKFYQVVKIERWIVGLSFCLGPIVFLVCLKALWEHYLYTRKKNRG